MPKVSFISRMTVKEGREAEFVALCNALAERVRASEPDLLIYEFYKLREPRRYCVFESFPSEAAEHAHMSTPHLAEFGPKIADCVEGTWVREYLDPLPG